MNILTAIRVFWGSLFLTIPCGNDDDDDEDRELDDESSEARSGRYDKKLAERSFVMSRSSSNLSLRLGRYMLKEDIDELREEVRSRGEQV